jgi:hypothetical protein
LCVCLFVSLQLVDNSTAPMMKTLLDEVELNAQSAQSADSRILTRARMLPSWSQPASQDVSVGLSLHVNLARRRWEACHLRLVRYATHATVAGRSAPGVT